MMNQAIQYQNETRWQSPCCGNCHWRSWTGNGAPGSDAYGCWYPGRPEEAEPIFVRCDEVCSQHLFKNSPEALTKEEELKKEFSREAEQQNGTNRTPEQMAQEEVESANRYIRCKGGRLHRELSEVYQGDHLIALSVRDSQITDEMIAAYNEKYFGEIVD